MQKNLVAHKKDEETYKRHLCTFNEAFPTFIYRNPDSSEPFNPIQEVEDVECSGKTKGKMKKKQKI